MFLVSSNRKKLAEIARYGLDLDLRPIEDLPEIDGTPDQVAIHKALAAGTGAIVEDTILFVAGHPWVDVRWTLDKVQAHAGDLSVWRTTLAHNDGQSIRLYVGEVPGRLVAAQQVRPDAFGFDPWFCPDGYDLSLDELEQAGRKDEVSARRRAVQALLAKQPTLVVPIDQVPTWEGGWQAEGAKKSPTP